MQVGEKMVLINAGQVNFVVEVVHVFHERLSK